jgi:undecaprenyl diphosphate synthase
MKKINGLIFISATIIIAGCFLWVLYAHIQHPALQSSNNIRVSVRHLGIIMDGNRRWARARGLPPWIGHRKGVEPLKATVAFCLKHKIPYLTVYAFSLENFKRPPQELDYLFNTLAQELESSELQELFKEGVQVRFIGDRSLFPTQVIKTINNVEDKTKSGHNLVLNILFCYGGQQELVSAAKALAYAVYEGKIKPEDITQDLLEEKLWLGKISPPDLIIRTGGMQRLSNFLAYQSAYSELYFLDCHWPEVTAKHLKKALDEFERRKRTFGG